jgi:hypothetical protein
MRVAAITWCCTIPDLQVYLFRRIGTDLVRTLANPSDMVAVTGCFSARI